MAGIREDMEGSRRDQEQVDYSTEENKNGSASSICSLRIEQDWSSYEVRTREIPFPASFIILYQSNHRTKRLIQNFDAFPFKANDENEMCMILSMIDKEETKKGFSQVPGQIENERDLEFIIVIPTKKNNKFKPKVGVEDSQDLHKYVYVAADAAGGFQDDDLKQEFWVKTSKKLFFTEEELEWPVTSSVSAELERMQLADPHQPSFSFKIVWRHPESPQAKINVIIELVAYNSNGESTTTSVTYPVQFNNFGEESFLSAATKNNRKAINQLSWIFDIARTILEQEKDATNNVIKILSDGEHLTAGDVENLSKSKERASEILHHVLRHEDVMPAFLDALRSTGHPQALKLVELITKPRPKE